MTGRRGFHRRRAPSRGRTLSDGEARALKTKIWILDRLPLTANRRQRAHWAALHRDAKDWRLAILSACGKPPYKITHPCAIEVLVLRARSQDPDNVAASLKPVLDALVWAGWLVDDCGKFLTLKAREKSAPKHARETVIRWTALPHGGSDEAVRRLDDDGQETGEAASHTAAD